jgi:hypothetical protein
LKLPGYYGVRTARMGQVIPHEKKTIYHQVLKLGANEASAQRLQNAVWNECHTKFFDKVMGI